MTTSTLETHPVEPNTAAPTDICAILSELSQSCRSKSKLYRHAVQAIAEHFGAWYAAIHITQSTSTLDERVHSSPGDPGPWDSTVEELLLESQAENVPIARLYNLEGTAAKAVALAVPVCEQSGRPIGAMSLTTRCDSTALAKLYLGEFTALVSLIASRAWLLDSEANAATEDDSALKRAVVKAADFESLDELAFAVTNSLKNKFHCDQVTLGQVERGKIRILSISGLDNVYPKSPGVKHICQAMEECLDSRETICCQEEDTWSDRSLNSGHRLHRHWYEEAGNTPVASVPLMIDDKCVAVLAMSRTGQSLFSEGELASIRQTVTPFAPAMALVAKADRRLFRHVTDSVRNSTAWLLAPRTYQRKAVAAAILAGIAYFCFATMDYEITVPSRITPTAVRCFAAPFEGTIKACHVRVGDQVSQGDLLYEMDTTAIQLQHDKLESDLAVLQLQASQALASEDVGEAALAGARMRVVKSQLAIARQNLAEAHIRAPADGTVVSGELSRRIGEVVALGTPLLEFVPTSNWSVELLVPETTATAMEVNFQGRFACNARPGEPLDCKIVRIRPSSEPLDGKNIFIAEAVVEENPAWMRTGMEGVAQIDAGRRRIWWVALHRVVDQVRLTLWL